MRADVLETSLRGLREIQRRRLRGLGVLPSLTSPMIPSGGARVGSDPDRRAYAVAEGTMYRVADATLATPLLRMVGPLSVPFTTPTGASATPGTTVMSGVRFGEGPGITTRGAGDPLGVGAETSEAAEAADYDRAASGGFITDDSVRDDSVREPADTSSATLDGWSRYKWWILGLLVTLTGAGGLWAWRATRRR